LQPLQQGNGMLLLLLQLAVVTAVAFLQLQSSVFWQLLLLLLLGADCGPALQARLPVSHVLQL
jgi:hypothetical protein